jgi:hypothetical protein
MGAGFGVVVYSCRALCPEGKAAIEQWLVTHGFPAMKVVGEKPWACIYIDDRGYQFNGTEWPTAQYIRNFKPWNSTDSAWQVSKQTRLMARGFSRIRVLRAGLQGTLSDREREELGNLLDRFVLGVVPHDAEQL